MKRAIKMASLTLGIIIMPFFAVATHAQPYAGSSQNPLAGSRVFGSKGCSQCHAVNGVGGKIAADLGRIAKPRTFYDLASAMWNHLPEMTGRRCVPHNEVIAGAGGGGTQIGQSPQKCELL